MPQDPMALATTDELQERLPFVMDEGEIREAEGALASLSDEARERGNPNWEPGGASLPRQVRNIILKAAARYMKNYEGYISSRAGDEDVRFSDRGDEMGDPVFNAQERRSLKELGENYSTQFYSVGLVAYQSYDRTELEAAELLVPVQGGGTFPYVRGLP